MKLYNTLSREIEDFKPINEDQVTMYTCGPTVYNYAHIGNLRTYIHEDILEKTLIFLGYTVKRAMNVTDVGHLESDADEGEDKMLKGAKRENKTVWEVAKYYTDAFFKDAGKLNIKKPEIVVNATDYIDDYVEFISVLEEKGYTYNADGNVYYDISKFSEYTKLSRMPLEDLKVAHRDDVDVDAHKKSPFDFVLWFTKSKFENQAMKWDTKYGTGYPGWHLECSVISLRNLGEQMDIHCGGVDHIPVHHTNEIAQTESYTGKPWVKYWWHSEFLVEDSGKMSKSKGEFLTVSLLESKGYSPLAYRYYVLNSHYRKQLRFSFESLDMASKAYDKLKARTLSLGTDAKETEKYLPEFRDALADDLNTANAITVLYDVLKDDELSDPEKRYLVSVFDEVLSLDLLKEEQKQLPIDEEKLKKLIEERNEAKLSRDYAAADRIRDELKELGITLVDTKEGTMWKLS